MDARLPGDLADVDRVGAAFGDRLRGCFQDCSADPSRSPARSATAH